MTAKKVKEQVIEIPAPNLQLMKVKLVADTPIIFHKFAEKSKRKMLEIQQKKPGAKKREIRDPLAEYYGCYYIDSNGHVAAKVDQVKKSMVEAARYLEGVPMTLLRGSVFIVGDRDNLIPVLTEGKPIKLCKPKDFVLYPEEERTNEIWGHDKNHPEHVFMREDVVVLQRGASDLRYRPMIRDWALEFLVKFNADLLSAEQVMNLFQHAGFGNGLCEWRPQKSGSYGTFSIASSAKAKKAE